VQLAEADAMNESLGLARREALWALKALRDEPLELFAAAAQREARTIEEVREQTVSLRPMTTGGEVVADYRHSHMLDEQPRLFFLHFWAVDDAMKLAKGRQPCRSFSL
jgi:error-prone DNA polymerase